LINKLELATFLELSTINPVCDVRSPAEYAHAHFPGAFNLPLLNNEERAIVGTTYKKEGNEAAVIKGYELVAHKFIDYIKDALKIAPNKKINLYCWRGGLRSNIMAFLLHTAGFEVNLVQGGYKKYRQWVIQTLEIPQQVKVLGGKTGSGKTYILHELGMLGEQIIDLEGLANHKGSAFGGLGQEAQPSVEMFENKLAMQWIKLNHNKTLWLENESRMIGTVRIPPKIFEIMRSATTYDIQISLGRRIQHIAKEYGNYEVKLLEECTRKLEKKMGNLRMQQAIDFLLAKDLNSWIFMLLDYYDSSYLFSKEKRNPDSVISVAPKHDASYKEIAQLLMAFQNI